MESNKKAHFDKVLYDFVDSIQIGIEKANNEFFGQWNILLKNNMGTSNDFHIEKFIDIYGGYCLPYENYLCMSTELKKFFTGRAKKIEDIVFLRGYDYYQVDPVVHLNPDKQNRNSLWNLHKHKWEKYSLINFSYINENLSVNDWIGTLCVLEYLFSDLTSFRWFLFKNKNKLPSMSYNEFRLLVEEIESYTEMIGETIAAMLKFDFVRAKSNLEKNYSSIIDSNGICTLLEINFEIEDKSSVRTIREGDSIALIFASYLMKLKPFCEQQSLHDVLFISNAFGAMNIGIILKYLMAPFVKAENSNVVYVQMRQVSDSVYGEIKENSCYLIDESNLKISTEKQAIFVVDDSIFTGNSYIQIKKFVETHARIYMLPLTVNCSALKYCRLGIKETDDMRQIARRVFDWSIEVGKMLPAFSSFWEFDYVPSKHSHALSGMNEDSLEVRAILNGYDVMLKHLWKLYKDEIL